MISKMSGLNETPKNNASFKSVFFVTCLKNVRDKWDTPRKKSKIMEISNYYKSKNKEQEKTKKDIILLVRIKSEEDKFYVRTKE